MQTDSTPADILAAARTVLVVDDKHDARDLMARLLRHAGYRAVTAGDGESALAAVDTYLPDLVLLDVTMPDMDGLEVLRRLRANVRYRDLPVVLFTAVSDRRIAAEARRLGAADYLLKGTIDATELFARISRHGRAA